MKRFKKRLLLKNTKTGKKKIQKQFLLDLVMYFCYLKKKSIISKICVVKIFTAEKRRQNPQTKKKKFFVFGDI